MEFITTHKQSLLKKIEEFLEEANNIKIASPFIDEKSFRRVIYKANYSIEILTDLRYYQICPGLLEYCLDEGIGVKVFYEEGRVFHGKLVLIYCEEYKLGICGSSNFTLNGLEKNLELNFIIKEAEEAALFQKLEVFFKKLWHGRIGNVVNLTKELIEDYKSNKKKKELDISYQGRKRPYQVFYCQ